MTADRCPCCGQVLVRSPAPLTRRQRQVLDFVTAYHGEHRVTPTLSEIADALGLTLPTIHEHLVNLERKGHLRRRGAERGRELITESTRVS
jgi:repressor LexA